MAEIILPKEVLYSLVPAPAEPICASMFLIKQIDGTANVTKQRHLFKIAREMDKEAEKIAHEHKDMLETFTLKDKEGKVMKHPDGRTQLDIAQLNKEFEVMMKEPVTITVEQKSYDILVEILRRLPVNPGSRFISIYEELLAATGVEPEEEPVVPTQK